MKYLKDVKYKGYLIEPLMYQQNDGGFMVLFNLSKDGKLITDERFTNISKAKKAISEHLRNSVNKEVSASKINNIFYNYIRDKSSNSWREADDNIEHYLENNSNNVIVVKAVRIEY